MVKQILPKLILPIFICTLLPTPVQAADFETEVFPGSFMTYAIRTEHFQIEYDYILSVQPDLDGSGMADLIEEVAEYAEYSWEREVEDLGFEPPVSDGTYIPLILDHNSQYLLENTVGITSALMDGTPYMAIDPWQSDSIIQVTVAHEFMHCIQFAYDIYFLYDGYDNQSTNFAEASAVWGEDYVYDDVNDYVYYLPNYLNYPDYSIFASSDLGSYMYGLSIWHKFLTEYYEDDGLIVEMWENFFDGTGDGLAVYDATKDVVESRGDDFADIYQEFALWNLAKEDFYEEGEIYPDIAIIGRLNSYPVESRMPSPERFPALYGSNYIVFDVPEGEEDFSFSLAKTSGVEMGVTIVPAFSGRDYDLDEMFKDTVSAEYTTAEYIFQDASDYDQMYVIISPLGLEEAIDYSTFDIGYAYEYSADFGDFEEEWTLITEEEVVFEEVEEKGNEEIEDEYVRGSGGFNLSIISYDEDSVTLNWNRNADLDIDYYVVSYGEEADVYTGEKEVSAPWITSSTVSDLSSDSVYYFVVEAYSEDGSLLDSSEEIAGFTVDFAFSDLHVTDEAYESVMELYELGIIQGYDDGTFKPNNTVNRAELLKILIEGLGIEPDEDVYRDCFFDVTDEWYAPHVCYAKEQGWVSGYDGGNFQPADTVNKVEALKMLLMVNGYELDESEDVYGGMPYTDTWPTAWYAVYVDTAFELGILTEEEGGVFEPDEGRTRGEICMELWGLLGS